MTISAARRWCRQPNDAMMRIRRWFLLQRWRNMSDTKQGSPAGCVGALTRRRAIRIIAAAAGLPLMIAAVRATAPGGRLFEWQGEVLGALAELSLWHTDEAAARRTIRQVETEIARYERIFSLAQADSEISRLNAAGALA